MKILHINHSDISGGAARAAYRIHNSLREEGLESRMWVNRSTAGDWTVNGPVSKVAKAMALLRPQMVSPLVKMLKTNNRVIHSPAILPSHWIKKINYSDADIVHLHWIQSEMLSIADISRIKKPIVWTLHDMWAFCGAEHYSEDFRWREGYRADNRFTNESGFDLNRWVWQRKRQHWKRPLNIVAPSQWLGNCAKESFLMRNWPITVVKNPIDTDIWKPHGQVGARELLGLPVGAPLLLFGAMDGDRDPRKGFEFLVKALKLLRDDQRVKGMGLVIFGQLAPESIPNLGFPVYYTGHLYDDLSLRILYSAADAMIIPSRQDNLPNTGVESIACGTPVVAFNVGGFPDIVRHKETGYLANAFDPEDLAQGIRWVLLNGKNDYLRREVRKFAEENFSYKTISNQYKVLYQKTIETSCS